MSRSVDQRKFKSMGRRELLKLTPVFALGAFAIPSVQKPLLRAGLLATPLGEPAQSGLIKATPADGLSIGADVGSRVGDYNDAQYWTGKLRDVRYHRGALTEQELRAWARRPE